MALTNNAVVKGSPAILTHWNNTVYVLENLFPPRHDHISIEEKAWDLVSSLETCEVKFSAVLPLVCDIDECAVG